MTDTTTPERREILQRARAVRTLAKQRRWAEEMRAAGWRVTEPAGASVKPAPVLLDVAAEYAKSISAALEATRRRR